jgi:hypothetical protein
LGPTTPEQPIPFSLLFACTEDLKMLFYVARKIFNGEAKLWVI